MDPTLFAEESITELREVSKKGIARSEYSMAGKDNKLDDTQSLADIHKEELPIMSHRLEQASLYRQGLTISDSFREDMTEIRAWGIVAGRRTRVTCARRSITRNG